MKNKYLFIFAFLFAVTYSNAGTFQSTGVNTNWSNALSWNLTSGVDADGIPDADDDVTILNTHSITLSADPSNARSLTINFGGTLNNNGKRLFLRGNLTNSGTFSGAGILAVLNSTSIITSTSTLNLSTLSSSTANITIAAGTTLNIQSGTMFISQSSTINNNGSITVRQITRVGGNNFLNNLAGSSLTLTANHVSDPFITITNNVTSTVTLNIGVTSVPNLTYGNLVIAGSGVTKTVSSALNVNRDLTVNLGTTLALTSNTLNLGRNLSNSGTISNFSTLNLNGSANQTLSSSAALTIPTLVSTNTNTIILNTGTYNTSSAVNFAGGLTLNAAAILNLNTNTLNLAGSLSNAGTISNLQDVNLNGTVSTQNISSTSALSINNLTCTNGNGVNITSGTYSITNSLTVNNGQLDCGTNLVTLVSDITKTAYIAQSTGTMAGSMIVQRYIPAKTGSYSDLSSPVVSTTIDDWDDELYMTINAPNNVPGFPGGDGMISSPYEFWSVTEYNTATNWYDSILTGDFLNVGQGYSVWVADDDNLFPGRAIDSRGTPNMGDIPVSAIFDGGNPEFPGWNLIGNPHAAFIDWGDAVAASSNVNSNIQIYDGSGNYVDDFSNPEIAPGQGFWCEVTATTTVNFPQTCKRTTTSSSFMRASNVKNHDLKLRLSSNANSYFHEININYDADANLGFEQGKDIPFIKSPKQTAPYITFVDGTHKFIRNKMNTTSSLVVLPLEISTPIAGNYTVELEGLLSNAIYSEAYLLNNTTKEKLEIGDANAVTIYFEKGETNNNYSLILKKANVPFNFNGDNVSIFSTADFINIKGNFESAQTVKVEVYNIVGQLVMNTTSELLPNERITLSTADLQSEVYVVKVTTSNNQQFTNKIVVAK
jgi:hypothetical protein